ncbi:CLK4-associating serine/arginine rich protein-like [Sinocyclocheilus grahami]|uniref:CLK4-associating serine/arginine rich protein-like n=1 Tax=Sinocyclocheilus grahami TaxID=75366 RepID=UPI0007AD4109|nr:PREDICTED: CLK4-associating serine/arginine rich protein-like [Sinocyclocheilus grahami]
MWQEARKHERKLRGMMVDYKRRGERRREYYEKIKKDPAQFLQVHGRAYKIHLDSAVALAAESPLNMMPWQGDTSNMIDRFDVRAHLDYIPTYTPTLLNTTTPEQESEERKCNYERYRGLVQNDFANISEEQCLYQIYVDELYGGLQKPNEDEKKKLAEKKAQIGYTYEDTTFKNSYARRDSPTYDPYKRPESDSSSESRSRSRTPGNDKITFITSFGGSDDEGASAAQAPPAAVSSHTSSNTAGHSRGSRRRRSSSSHSSFSSHSSSHRSSRSSSRSRRSRRSRGGRDRDSRYSRSRSRRRSDSRSRQRSGGVGSRRRYDRTRSRSTDRGRDRNRERDRGRDRGRRYTGRRQTRSRSHSRSGDRYQRRSCSSAYRRGGSISQSPSHSPAASRSLSPSSHSAPPTSASADKLRKPENPGGKETGAAKPKMTPQEKLRLRMQKALNKQSKADKKAAHAKIQQQEHKRQEREGVLRTMARKIRMKERERREKERDEWERLYGRQSHSPSPNAKYSRDYSSSRRRSRSRSRSPHYRY